MGVEELQVVALARSVRSCSPRRQSLLVNKGTSPVKRWLRSTQDSLESSRSGNASTRKAPASTAHDRTPAWKSVGLNHVPATGRYEARLEEQSGVCSVWISRDQPRRLLQRSLLTRSWPEAERQDGSPRLSDLKQIGGNFDKAVDRKEGFA